MSDDDDETDGASASADDRGQPIDTAPAPRAADATLASKPDTGKGQSDTGRADQTDDKASSREDAAHAAFDPDEEQV